MSTTKRKIKRGETSTGIANQYGITVKELMKLNPNITDPNRIYAGADIIVPVAVGGITGSSGGSTAGSGKTNSNPYNLPTAPTYQNTAWSDTDQGKAAWNTYQNYLNQYNNFGDFAFSKQGDLDSVYGNIKNYQPFSYDVNSDALYQQYADQYTRLGNMAMQDTMGQAAAMTGGYGNSYATTAGNQAYQGYLQQLNDVVPELYQMALNKWQMGKDDLYDQYGLLLSEYEREYGLHSDQYNQLLDALGLARSDYYDGADMHYTEQGNYNDILATQFGDKMSIWDANQSQSNWEKDYALSERQLAMQEEEHKLKMDSYKDDDTVKNPSNNVVKDDETKTPTSTVKPTKTQATTSFIANHKTINEWARGGKSTSSYYEYIDSEIRKIEDSLSDEELMYLKQYYGF